MYEQNLLIDTLTGSPRLSFIKLGEMINSNARALDNRISDKFSIEISFLPDVAVFSIILFTSCRPLILLDTAIFLRPLSRFQRIFGRILNIRDRERVLRIP